MTLDDCPSVMNMTEAGQAARVERRLVSRAVHRGELRALVAGRTVRITKDALIAWLQGENAIAQERPLSRAIRPTNRGNSGRPG